ncbi:MAG: alpha/beta fold hydrolase [Erysipelotrichia bacterium]|nr:alpha/beta fold hydrolase [Erysipelotrichia bacterium]
MTEGTMPFLCGNTWYRITGKSSDNRKPLLLLHGGPGSTHNYFEMLDSLADSGRMIVSYDQIGCGNSYLDHHPEYWTADTWLDELSTLRSYLHLDELHILGQSWGGMLTILYLNHRQPEGIRSVILSSSLSSASLWKQEQHRMIRQLPVSEQNAIYQAEKTGNYEDQAYIAANAHYMELHCMGTPTSNDPDCIRRPKRTGRESYLYGWGPNEYSPTGTLKNYEETESLGKLKVPSLIISGTDDLCTPLVAKTMYDAIPNAEWHLIQNARHMCFYDQNQSYCQILSEWLERND